MLRKTFFLAVCVVAIPFGLARAASEESAVRVEAYLEQAPAAAKVVDQIRVGRHGRDRLVVIVSARGEGREPVTTFSREGRELPAFHLEGRADQVARVMEGSHGERIEATLTHGGNGSIVIRDVSN